MNARSGRRNVVGHAPGSAVRSYLVGSLFLLSGVSLFFGMALAAIYALRAFVLPLPWLDIPWMRALHGTLNAFGFGLCSMLAWRSVTDKNTKRDSASESAAGDAHG